MYEYHQIVFNYTSLLAPHGSRRAILSGGGRRGARIRVSKMSLTMVVGDKENLDFPDAL